MAARKKSTADKRLTKARRVLSGYARSGHKTAQATVDELARLFGTASAAVIGSGRRKARKGTKPKASGRKTVARKVTVDNAAGRKSGRRKSASSKTSTGRGRPATKRVATSKRSVTKGSAPNRAGRRPIKRGRKVSR